MGKKGILACLMVTFAGVLLAAVLAGVAPVPWGSGGPAAARTAELSGGLYNPEAVSAAQSTEVLAPKLVNFQGLLTDPGTGNPLEGIYNLTFRIYDSLVGGSLIWDETQTIAVSGGLFNVQLGAVSLLSPLDASVFDGTPRYLEVQVEADPPMAPRLPFTTVPYAFHAETAEAAGFAQDASTLDGLDSADFWKLGGNSATTPGVDFLGTSDSKAIEIHVNGQRAWRIEPATSPNVIGGFNANDALFGVVGATIGGGGENAGANTVSDDFGTVGGGSGNQAGDNAGSTADRLYATVGGGSGNTASGSRATVSGGIANTAGGTESAVGGGNSNSAGGSYDTIGGGLGNETTADFATIAGGGRTVLLDPLSGNRVTDEYGTVGGGGNNQAGDNAGTTTDRPFATVAGGEDNTASGLAATVAGGFNNTASGTDATVGGGAANDATDVGDTVSGGSGNAATGQFAAVGGGTGNVASDEHATVAGGSGNAASGFGAAVAGGGANTASATNATVGGGGGNTASGFQATVPGGLGNEAGGAYSLAAGRRATIPAGCDGTFVWADSNDFDYPLVPALCFDNQFLVRATQPAGGVLLTLGIDGSGGTTWFCVVSDGTSWTCSSDRNMKENLVAVDGRETLERLEGVPIFTWNGKGADPSVQHIGPMAQDFYAAFGVGQDDKMLATIDLDGVALSAIKGLYEMVEEQEAQIAALEKEMGLEGAGDEGSAAGSEPAGSGTSIPWPAVGGLALAALAVGAVAVRRSSRGGWQL